MHIMCIGVVSRSHMPPLGQRCPDVWLEVGIAVLDAPSPGSMLRRAPPDFGSEASGKHIVTRVAAIGAASAPNLEESQTCTMRFIWPGRESPVPWNT